LGFSQHALQSAPRTAGANALLPAANGDADGIHAFNAYVGSSESRVLQPY